MKPSSTVEAFDFRGKRLKVRYRKHDRFMVENKSGIAYMLRAINYDRYLYADDVSSYEECKANLLKELKAHPEWNYQIIE